MKFNQEEVMEKVTNPEVKFYCVSIYLVDRAEGGPEEGGWWYTYGDPAPSHAHLTRIFKGTDEEAANEYAHELRQVCGELNVGRRPISSMASIGQYDVVIDEDGYPAHFPAQRPFYE
jgi:hypothetical protein